MKRVLPWLFSILVLAGLGGVGLRAYLRRAPEAPVLGDRMAWISGAAPSVAFVLDGDHRLEYSVPGKVEQIRLLINANLKPGVLEEGLSPEKPRKARSFRLELEERDSRGRTLNRQEWRFLAPVSAYRDPEQGQLRSALFFVDRDWVPSNGSEVMLEGLRSRRVSSIRLRVLETDPEILDLIVRAYSPVAGTDVHQWDRLADPVRTQLLSGNVYPEGLLRQEEKENLLARTWQPLAPNSPWGRSPLQRQVYQVLAPLQAEAGADYKPQGLRIDPTRLGVFHLPMAGGRFRLKALAWEPRGAGQPDPYLKLHWVGPGLGNQSSHRIPWPEDELTLETSYAGGFLIVEANRPGSIRAWGRGAAGEVEITPAPDTLGCTLLNPGQTVAFAVPPPEGDPIAFRLDVRQILAHPDAGTVRPWRFRSQITARWPVLRKGASCVWYEILDGEGRRLQRGRLPVDPWLSPLEELPESFATARVSLPASTAMLLPAAAREIRVSLEPEPHSAPPPAILVSGYGRPQALPHVRNLPEDFFLYDTRETRLPEWYAQEPNRQEELIREKRWIGLRTQYLPDALDEGLLTGPYELDPLNPVEASLAREILVPRREAGLLPREDGLSSYFRELIPEGMNQVELHARAGIRNLRPSLLRIGGAGSATQMSLECDDSVLPRIPVGGVVQETLLPPLAPGPHRFRIRTPQGGRCFLSHQWPGPTDWSKRVAYAWRPGHAMVFRHARTSRQPESMTLGFFAPKGAGGEAVIKLKLTGVAPSVGTLLPVLTRTERRFRIRLEPGREAFLLAGDGAPLGVFPLVALPFGPDLPAGNYRLECTLESGPVGFLTLSRAQAGVRPKSLVDQETLIGARP